MKEYEVNCNVVGFAPYDKETQDAYARFDELDCGVLTNLELIGASNEDLEVQGVYTMYIKANDEDEALDLAIDQFAQDIKDGKVDCKDLEDIDIIVDEGGQVFRCIPMYEIEYINDSPAEFAIYQIKSGEKYHFNRFEDYDTNEGKLSMNDYDCVYSGIFEDGWSDEEILNKLFYDFNMNRPEDFKGHSMSVSDVVVIERNGNSTAYYTDRVGFKEMPEFFENTKTKAKDKPMEIE